MKFCVVSHVLLICVASLGAAINGEPSDVKIKSERQFRSGKVHQLWEKAQHINLPSATLIDLYDELQHHDYEWMKLKGLKAQGGDENGLIEAELRREFSALMFKYGLIENDKEKNFEQELKAQDKNKEPFQDRKLNALWKNVKSRGKFSSAEMDKLFVEFKHHQDKLTELHGLQVEMNENGVAGNIAGDSGRISKAKELYDDITDSYLRLQNIAKKSNDDSAPFVEPRVLDLWSMMKESNFTEEEKKSLEEELKHFEARIEKHRYFKEELKNAAEKVEFHGDKSGIPAEKLTRFQKLQSKVYELSNRMQKTYANLRSRIGNGVIKHKEL